MEPKTTTRVHAALAMAQAAISNAMLAAGITRRELARRMNTDKANVTRMLSGGYPMSLRTFTRALLACGFEPRFGFEPIGGETEIPGPGLVEADTDTTSGPGTKPFDQTRARISTHRLTLDRK